MVSTASFRKLALSFPSSVELPHFDKASFRVSKKIFATLDEKASRVCVTLTEADQSMFSSSDKSIIYPVPNKWGKHGWTFVELKKVKPALLKAVVMAAYDKVAAKKKPASPRKGAKNSK
jgi:predicted DNA-binding protein (MmcQ/YjbR family)